MNTVKHWQTTARIVSNSQRVACWQEVFGGDRAPVKSMIPRRLNLPDKGDSLVYELDIQALSPEQRERLIQSIARRFGRDPAEVEALLDKEGCPLVGDDLIISSTDYGQMITAAELAEELGLGEEHEGQ